MNGRKKLRPAPRTSSLVLVSAMSGGAATASAANVDVDTPSGDAPSGDSPSSAPAQADTVTAAPASRTPPPDASAAPTPPPADAAAPPHPPSPPEPAPEKPVPEKPAAEPQPAAAEAATAKKPVETIEPAVEPGPAAAQPRNPAEPSMSAQEAQWQAVEGERAANGEPAAAVLEHVGTSRAPGSAVGRVNAPKAAGRRRRGFFNQDDAFGVMFGLAMLAFLLMWFFRGKPLEAPDGDDLVTAQGAEKSTMSIASLTPPPDPFGNKPVDLRPTGPIPEPPTAATPAPPAAVTESLAPPAAAPPAAVVAPPSAATPPPAAATVPPPAVAKPPPPAAAATPAPTSSHAFPLAGRKLHAWFCTASSRLPRASRDALTDELDAYKEALAGQQFVVRGYADTRGPTELNTDLGARRARTVGDFLVSKGFSVVDVQGVGELDGLDDNQNCPNQRRVDVWLKGTAAEAPSRECAPEPAAAQLVCG